MGDFETDYSYTPDFVWGQAGEMTDGTGLVYLRARYREFCAPERFLRVGYDPATGRFVNKDTWGGDYNNPITLAKWLYANGNPVVYVDPSGNISCTDPDSEECISRLNLLLSKANDLKQLVKNNNLENASLMPVEALAQLTDYAFVLFDNDRRGMMWAMTRVLVGIEPTDYRLMALQPVNEVLREYGIENEINYEHFHKSYIDDNWLPYKKGQNTNISLIGDWNPKYFDGTANQAFHFWYYAASSYFEGSILASIANIVHDPYFLESEFLYGPDLEKLKNTNVKLLSHWVKNVTQTSREDYELGLAGIQFGNYVNNPLVFNLDPGKWIRNHLKAKEYR